MTLYLRLIGLWVVAAAAQVGRARGFCKTYPWSRIEAIRGAMDSFVETSRMRRQLC